MCMASSFRCRFFSQKLLHLTRQWNPTICHFRNTTFSTKSHFNTSSSFQHRAPLRSSSSGLRVFCLGSLTTALALVAAAPDDHSAPTQAPAAGKAGGDTLEKRMLEASEREPEVRSVSEDLSLIRRAVRSTVLFVVDYIIEPIATGWRFVTLVAVFTPVILAIPCVYLGERLSAKSGERTGTLWWYGFLIRSLERAGPTFIKLGQWAASRSDIFPMELCHMMSRLHSNAIAHPLRDTKRIICRAFGGQKFEDIFEEFEEVPLGVGAIAQVYKGKIQPNMLPSETMEGKKFRRHVREAIDGLVKFSPGQGAPSSYVAIKVVHPQVEKIVHRDLRIMRFFADLLNAVPTLEWFSFPDEVATFSDMMRLQMDLRIEAENLAKFRYNFRDRSTVTFPRPYRDYTTRDILIEEFAHGIPLAAFLESGGGVFQDAMANMGLDAFLHMLVMDNFIHSDLHPGNIMIRFLKPSSPRSLLSRIPFISYSPPAEGNREDATSEVHSRLMPHRRDPHAWTAELAALDAEGYRPQLVFIDAGLVTQLNAANRRNFLDLFRAIAEFDGYRAGHLMIERSRSPHTVVDNEIFALKIQRLVLAVKQRTLALGNISFGDVLSEVLQMVRTHHVRMEGDFVTVILSMLLLEGIGRALDPRMDLLKSSLPMLRAVGTGAARHAGDVAAGNGGTTLSLLKVWLALETRQFVAATIKDIENCVKYDLLSPNI